MVFSLVQLLVRTATLAWLANISASAADEVDSMVTDPPQDGVSDEVRNGVVAGVIGIGSFATLCLFIVCGILHCYFTKDKVRDLDAMEYIYQDEYEARINFDVLDQLEPGLRANIDMDFLAQLTNTDPALLAKYKTVAPTCTHTSGDSVSIHDDSSSPDDINAVNPAQTSLTSIHLVQGGDGRTSPAGCQRSATVKVTSTPQSPAVKRVSTLTDIHLLNTSLNLSQTGLSRHASLLRQSQAPYRGSQPNMAEGHVDEGLAQELLRMLTKINIKQHSNENPNKQ